MNILNFIRGASPLDLRLISLLTVVAGVANAFLVVMVNRAATVVASGARPGLLAMAAFVGVFALYYWCNREALLRANETIERLLLSLRTQTIDELRRAELETMERLGRGNLYNLVSTETNQLSVAFPLIVDCMQQAVLLTVALLYLAWLSQAAFVVFVVSVGVAIFGYHRINEEFRLPMEQAQARQAAVLDLVGDIVDGFKEQRLNSERGEALRLAYEKATSAVEESRDAAGAHWATLLLLANIISYFMLGIIALVLPGYLSSRGEYVFQLIPTILFCVAPLVRIVALSPMFMQADQGLRGILDGTRQALGA